MITPTGRDCWGGRQNTAQPCSCQQEDKWMRQEHLGISLTKEAEDLHTENHEKLM